MKITGYQRSDFKGRDGALVTGINVYLSQTIASGKGKGQSTEKVYLTDAKLERMGLDIAALYGADVAVMYDRYGKVADIVVKDNKA